MCAYVYDYQPNMGKVEYCSFLVCFHLNDSGVKLQEQEGSGFKTHVQAHVPLCKEFAYSQRNVCVGLIRVSSHGI